MLNAEAPAVSLAVSSWSDVFLLASYGMLTGCIYGAIARGAKAGQGRGKFDGPVSEALRQVGILLFFVFAFWFLESYAHDRTPYYLYSDTFRDLLPRASGAAVKWLSASLPPPRENFCTVYVRQNTGLVPLSVPFFEASLTYSAMWTARFVGAALWAEPLLAGLAMVAVDVLLDPTVASTRDCGDKLMGPANATGVGLWRWFLPGDQTPDALAHFFGVPVFNFAAWLCAPIILVSLVNLAGKFRVEWLHPQLRRLFAWSRGRACDETITRPGVHGVIILTIVAFTWVLVAASPAFHLARPGQYAVVAGALMSTFLAFFWNVGQFETQYQVDQTLTWPVILALGIPSLAALFSGEFLVVPSLMPVALLAFLVAISLAFLPYRRALETFAEGLGWIDGFIRIHYFGFTAMLVLLGAALFRPEPNMAFAAALVGAALAFHVYAYVLNDVIDLEHDKNEPRRKHHPLVAEAITPEAAAGIAAGAFGVGILSALHATGFDFSASVNRLAVGVFVGGLILMTIYNVWGKVCPVPPITDLVQGVAWGSLALFGALSAASVDHRASTSSEIIALVWDRAGSLFLYGTGFIFLINGVHGGVRDLENDSRNHKRTTAIFLGAKVVLEGKDKRVVTGPALWIFAYAVQTLLFADAAYELHTMMDPNPTRWVALVHTLLWPVLLGLFAFSSWMLWQVVRPGPTDRERQAGNHLIVLLLPPMLIFLAASQPCPAFKYATACAFLLPPLLRERIVKAAIARLYKNFKSQRGAPPAAAGPSAPAAGDSGSPPLAAQ
jgi:4-hydroxybenzoate polyprenyltransferase